MWMRITRSTNTPSHCPAHLQNVGLGWIGGSARFQSAARTRDRCTVEISLEARMNARTEPGSPSSLEVHDRPLWGLNVGGCFEGRVEPETGVVARAAVATDHD